MSFVRLRPIVVLLFAATISPQLMRGQSPLAASETSLPLAVDISHFSCLDTLSVAHMRPVRVFLSADLPDTTGQVLLPQLDLLTLSVAQHLRQALSAATDSLPVAESRLTWRNYGAQFSVIAHRNGSVGWRRASTHAPPDTVGSAWLTRAIEAAIGEDSLPIVWPERLRADSVVALLVLNGERLDSAGAIHEPHLRRGFGVFSVASPWEEPTVPGKMGKVW